MSDPLAPFIKATPKGTGTAVPHTPAGNDPLGGFITPSETPSPKVAPVSKAPAPKPQGGIGGFITGIEQKVEGFFGKKPVSAPKKVKVTGDPLAPFIQQSKQPKGTKAGTKKPDPLAPHINKQALEQSTQGPFALLPQMDQPTSQSTPQNPSTTEGATFWKDTAEAVPGALATTLKDVAQAFPRDAVTITNTLGQAASDKLGSEKYAGDVAGRGMGISTKDTWWGKYIFGEEPLKTVQAQVVGGGEQTIKDSAFAKKFGFDKHATGLAVLGATIPLSLDFLGAGGEKTAIDALINAGKKGDVADVARVLRQIGVHEDMVLSTAEHITSTKGTRAEVEAALKSVDSLQKASHAVPGKETTDTTTKGAEAVIRGDAHTMTPDTQNGLEGVLPGSEKAKGHALEGKPIYHGTTEKFDKFSSKKGYGGSAWFSDSKKAVEGNMVEATKPPGSEWNVMERYIRPGLNLVDRSTPEGKHLADQLMRGQLEDRGYAGIIHEADAERGKYVELFNPSKDAITKKQFEKLSKGSKEATQVSERTVPKTTRSVAEVQKALEDVIQHDSYLKDVVDYHPGKQLMKYRSAETGALPEVRGTKTFAGDNIKGTRGAFAAKGDQIIQDLLGQELSGGGDLDVAQKHLDDYIKVRDQHKEVKQNIKALRQELKDAKEQAKMSAKLERTREEIQKPAPQKDFKTRAEKQEGTLGDYLRRGAEVVRGGKQTGPIAETVVRGNASAQAQRSAVLESLHGGIESGPFKGFSEHMRNWYQDWIFQRQSVDLDTKAALKKFESFKNQDPEHFWSWMHDFLGKELKTDARDGRTYLETGSRRRTGNFAQVEDLLDKWLSEEQAAGIKVADKDNYLPIYLKNAADRSEETLAEDRRLGLRPGFSLRSEFKDYVEAKAAGYDPKYENLYDVLKTRARAHYKAMADATFFRDGTRNGWIIPETAIDPEVKRDFAHLDSERMPTQQAAFGNTVYRGVYTAPTRVADKINNFLRNPDTTLQKIADTAGALKSTALSVGIPDISKLPGIKQIAERSPEPVKDLLNLGSGMVVHFWNVLPREVMADFAIKPLQAPLDIAKYVYYGINPRAAGRYIEKNLAKAQLLSRNGMKITTEDQAFEVLDMSENAIGKLGTGSKKAAEYMHNLFGKNFFQKVMPARKIANGIRLMETYMKHGYTEKEAARAAANDMNVVYGGINWESLGRSRNFQAMLRGAILAPDYAETNIKQGARFIKAFAKPTSVSGKLYRGMMYTFATSYVLANLLNHENSGHWMYDNDLLHQFSIDMGKDPGNGKTRYLNIYGTGTEWARIPLYTITAIAKGDLNALHAIILNRLSIPYATVASLVLNVDWKGDPIFGPTKYGQAQTGGQEAQNAFDNTLGRIFPGSVSDVRSIASGKMSPAIGIPKALGVPITEKNTSATPADVIKLKVKAAEDVKKGDYRLLNELVKKGIISPRAKARFIRTARSGPTKKQIAQKAKTKAKAKAARDAATSLLPGLGG